MAELKVMIAETEKRLSALKLEEFNLEHGPRLEAIAKINNIMRAQQISIAELLEQ